MTERWPRSCAAALFVLVACLPRAAKAYRPFDGTDGDVADEGEFELELGPLHYLHEEGRNYLLAPATVLNLGILPCTELVVNFAGTVPLDRDPGEARYSVRDTQLFLKFLLRRGVLQDETGPSIALEAGALPPELNGEHGVGASANLIVSERWDFFLAHLNDELDLSRGTLEPVWSTSLITEYRFSETAWPVMELLWERELHTGMSSYSALVGAIWNAARGLDFDAALRFASTDNQFAFEARLGLTWTLEVWHREKPKPEIPRG